MKYVNTDYENDVEDMIIQSLNEIDRIQSIIDKKYQLSYTVDAKSESLSESYADEIESSVIDWGSFDGCVILQYRPYDKIEYTERTYYIEKINQVINNKNLNDNIMKDNKVFLEKKFRKEVIKLMKKFQEHETLKKEMITTDNSSLKLEEELDVLQEISNTFNSSLDFNKTEDIITDTAIDLVFGNTEFGKNETKRGMIAKSLLKIASGYEIGGTIKQIMENLGLVKIEHKGLTESYTKLTLLGKEFLYKAYE